MPRRLICRLTIMGRTALHRAVCDLIETWPPAPRRTALPDRCRVPRMTESSLDDTPPKFSPPTAQSAPCPTLPILPHRGPRERRAAAIARKDSSSLSYWAS